MSRYYARLTDAQRAPSLYKQAQTGARLMRETTRLTSRDELVLFVPGPDVSAFLAAFPERISRAVEQSCAFAIEEYLASAAQDVHAVIGPPADARRRWVWCAEAEKLRSWISIARETGASRFRIVPELSLLRPDEAPVQLGDVTLVFVDERPVAIEASWPVDVQKAVFDSAIAPTKPSNPVDWLIARAEEDAALVDLSRNMPGVDPLSGPQLDLSAKLLAAAAALFAFLLGHASLERGAQSKALAALNAGQVAQSVETKAALSLESFTHLSSSLMQAVQASPDTRILTLTYSREPDGQLRAALSHSDFNSGEALRAHLQQQGLSVGGSEARVEGSRILNEIVIGDSP
jgi:type II secretory pathway component PulL